MIAYKLAWRSLWRNKRRSIITLASIALGLMGAILFAAFITGVQRKTVGDATRMLAGHVTIEHERFRDDPSAAFLVSSVAHVREVALAMPEVESVKEVVAGQAMVSTAAGSSGAAFLAVDPASTPNENLIKRKIVRGRFLEATDKRGVVVGGKLAERLKLQPGSKLVFTSVDAQGERADTLLLVTGIYETGADEMDAGLIEIPLSTARETMGIDADKATQVGIVLKDPRDEDHVVAALEQKLHGQGVAVRRWQELLPELATWSKTTNRVHTTIGIIILCLVAATILNTVLMSVLERTREFAMVLALGTPPRLLRKQVLAESAILGILGAVFGVVLGVGLSAICERYGLNLASAYNSGASVGGFAVDMKIHTHADPRAVALLASIVLVLTALISLYPMIRSTRIALADALRGK